MTVEQCSVEQCFAVPSIGKYPKNEFSLLHLPIVNFLVEKIDHFVDSVEENSLFGSEPVTDSFSSYPTQGVAIEKPVESENRMEMIAMESREPLALDMGKSTLPK